MAENYKFLYEQMKRIVDVYQDIVVPGMREQLEKRVEVVRCKDCKHWKMAQSSLVGEVMVCAGQGNCYIQKAADDFCSYGERKYDDI